MRKLALSLGVSALFLCGGCSIWPKSDFSTSAEKSVRAADLSVDETRTLAGLSEIEEALRDYYTHERRIPDNLDALVPQYLAAIPTVELGLSQHSDTNRVTNYNPEILIDGVVDGARIGDTGGWGYVHTDRQVVVFVDCTHLSPSGAPWYSRQP